MSDRWTVVEAGTVEWKHDGGYFPSVQVEGGMMGPNQSIVAVISTAQPKGSYRIRVVVEKDDEADGQR